MRRIVFLLALFWGAPVPAQVISTEFTIPESGTYVLGLARATPTTLSVGIGTKDEITVGTAVTLHRARDGFGRIGELVVTEVRDNHSLVSLRSGLPPAPDGSDLALWRKSETWDAAPADPPQARVALVKAAKYLLKLDPAGVVAKGMILSLGERQARVDDVNGQEAWITVSHGELRIGDRIPQPPRLRVVPPTDFGSLAGETVWLKFKKAPSWSPAASLLETRVLRSWQDRPGWPSLEAEFTVMGQRRVRAMVHPDHLDGLSITGRLSPDERNAASLWLNRLRLMDVVSYQQGRPAEGVAGPRPRVIVVPTPSSPAGRTGQGAVIPGLGSLLNGGFRAPAARDPRTYPLPGGRRSRP